ncbi:hypothetical protein ACL02O_02210 [Micromonospora sp. MS34]|uniref:hypothetical protein n=1 Tax=Micromonospora sp. MS34 TaxID=3385971 RepID=UPI0039A2CE55
MRRRPVLVGGALAGAGALVAAVCGAAVVGALVHSADFGPAPLLGAGAGVLLALGGVTVIRDARADAAGQRAGTAPVPLLGAPSHPGFDWDAVDFSAVLDGGHGGHGGGGPDGGGGGDSGGGC